MKLAILFLALQLIPPTGVPEHDAHHGTSDQKNHPRPKHVTYHWFMCSSSKPTPETCREVKEPTK